MSNKIILKKSSVAAKIPLTTDLSYGELALNYQDGKLYFKDASNNIKSFIESSSVVTLTGTQTLTNKTLTAPSIGGVATFTGEVLINNAGGGAGTDEGGELHLASPTTNSTLNGPIAIDVYQNKVRIFETTGTNRGAYVDLTACSANAGTNLLSAGGSTTTISQGNSSVAVADSGTGTITTTVDGTVVQTDSVSGSAFSGIPTAPTATAGTSTTQIATTAFAVTEALNKAVAMAIALG